tara:strand:- start:14187 stop:16151 length:1965 start_codon:yes stop_codon:yes gene_type:complete
MTKFFYNVSIPISVDQLFIYHSSRKIDLGSRVKINFKNKSRVGIVIEKTNQPKFNTLTIEDILDESNIFSKNDLNIFKWISDYYHYPIGQVIDSFIPSKLKKLSPMTRLANVEHRLSNNAYKLTKKLTQEQKHAVDRIIRLKGFNPVLLFGVTGSGKTEIYIRAIADQIDRGNSVLLLVPEIALIPQMSDEIKKIFGDRFGLYHSGISPAKRLKTWWEAKNGMKDIIIGTRSSLMNPLKNLGMIIVDEEHDRSYKQTTGLTYSARDVAIKKAQLLNIPILLGSATPSLRSILNTQLKKYQLILLQNRIAKTKPPKFTICDISTSQLKEGLSDIALLAIQKTLKKNKQVMIFLNRRGYAPEFSCEQCGWTALCNHCETNMVFHQIDKRLICHRCNAAYGIPPQCPECNSLQLSALGLGTERIQLGLTRDTDLDNILRFDRDSTKKTGSLEKIIQRIKSISSGVIVGTQMLIKGHDFPNIELVIVVNADRGLTSLNPYAIEDLAQQLIQVTGRAGRLDGVSNVLVQSRHPKDRHLNLLKDGDYLAFSKFILEERKKLNLPPFIHQALLKSASVSINRNIKFLESAISNVSGKETIVLGPMASAIPKSRGKFHHHILIQSNSKKILHQTLDQINNNISELKVSLRTQWRLDVDPLDF